MTWRTIGSLRESPLQRLDVRSKLAFLLATTFLAFLWESPLLTGLLVALILLLCLIAGIRMAYLRQMLRLMLPFYAIVLLTHGFWNTSVGRTAIWAAPQGWWLIGGKLRLTSEGLVYGLMVVFRTLSLILVIPLVIFTTDLNQLIVGLVRIGLPYKVAFTFSATLRFVPLLLEEIGSISEAQRLRGLALEKMNLIKRLQVYARIAVPLILGAMTRSQQLEIVLATRAFCGSPQRTFLQEPRLRGLDYALVVLCLGVSLVALWLRLRTGLGRFVMP
ncbi:MAG: energy-coupling factor transporter transmembrane protein EcfT [Chloroflexi bacterium]|nr:energy-coupling factor transporter transmembrane protein EcfT [Chloroflexota bacterium]